MTDYVCEICGRTDSVEIKDFTLKHFIHEGLVKESIEIPPHLVGYKKSPTYELSISITWLTPKSSKEVNRLLSEDIIERYEKKKLADALKEAKDQISKYGLWVKFLLDLNDQYTLNKIALNEDNLSILKAMVNEFNDQLTINSFTREKLEKLIKDKKQD